MTTQSRKQVRNLADRLSRLAYPQACKLLGPQGKQLLAQGAKYNQIDVDRDVYLRGDLFRLTLRGAAHDGADVRVTISQMASRRDRLVWNCDLCGTACEHVGAAFSLILEDKYALGLSDIPKEGVPLEHLSAEELDQRAIAERAKRAQRGEVPAGIQSSGSALDRLCDHQPVSANPIAWRCAVERGDSFVRVPISALTRWEPASTSCTRCSE